MERRGVRDLPIGPALLALARDVLLHDLMPLLPLARDVLLHALMRLLPPEAHLEARLVVNSMAIAEREAMAGEEPAQEIILELKKLSAELGRGGRKLLG